MVQVFDDEHLNRLTVVTDEAEPGKQRVIDVSSFFACDIPDDLDFLLQDDDVPKFNLSGNPKDDMTPQQVSDRLDDLIRHLSDAVDNMDDIESILRGEEPLDGSYYQFSKDPEKDKEEQKEQNEQQEKEDEDEQDDGEGMAEPGESAIIEFAADSILADAEPHIWISKAGDPIDNETIIARCKEDNVMKPVKSIFKCGVVRKDPDDGSFGRLFKTVCSRHIIIDGIKDGKKHFLAADVDSSALLQLDTSLGYNMECFDLFTEQMPYLIYPKILARRTMKEPRDASSLLIKPFVSPEDEYVKFIDGVRAIQDRYMEEIKDLSSEDRIKGAGISGDKQKGLADGILDKREEYLDAIIAYCDKWKDVVDVCDTKSTSHPERFGFDKPLNVTVRDPYQEGDNRFVIIDNPSNQDMRDYYQSMLRKVIKGHEEDDGDLMKQYRQMLESFIERRTKVNDAKNHPDMQAQYGDGARLVEQETSELEEFFTKMKTCYETTSPSKCMAAIEAMKGKNIYAEWPEYTQYEYKGEIYRHYCFPNIDEYRKKFKAEDDDKEDAFEDDEAFNPSELPYPLGDSGLWGNGGGTPPKPATADDAVSPDVGGATPVDKDGDGDPVIRPENYDDPMSADTDIPHSKLKYWKRYCSIATLVTLPYLATGLVIAGVPILLPCIYVPLTVVSAPEIGSLVVVGIGIRGVMVLPMVIYVNYDNKVSTSVLAVLLAFDAVKNAFNMGLEKMEAAVPNVANMLIEVFKSNNDALLRENQKIRVQQGEMEKLIKQIPNWSTIKKNCRKKVGMETRNIITRIDDTVNAAGVDVTNLVEDIEGNTLGIAAEMQGMNLVNRRADK